MEGFDNALCPTEARTPEPQRLYPGTRGSNARAAGRPHACSELDRYDGTSRAQREGEVDAFRTYSTDAWLQGQSEPDPKALRTPPTISRHNWLQLQAHVGEAHQLRSPPSFAPTVDGAPALHNTGRRLSCPSANRSVAPARYSIEYNMMGSGRGDSSCRHTTLLTSTSGLHDTPLSRASAAGARAIRPTVLLPATTGASGGDVLWEGGRCFGLVDGDAIVRERAIDRHHGGRASADPSVPLLTRFSCGSHDGGGSRGTMSPGVRSGMGRPTTLRCADVDFAACSQWDGGRCNEDEEEEPWLGGTTQVWRNSAELTMGPAVATQRSAFPSRGGETCGEDCYQEEVEGEEEVVVLRAARAAHGGAYSNSPEVVWRPMALAAGAAPAWPSVSQPEAPHFGQHTSGGRDEESAEATDDSAPHGGDLPDDADASLTGLCDAPRKSYVRSTTHSPLRGNGVSGAQQVMCASQESITTAASTTNARWGAVDPRCSTQAEGRHSDDALTAPLHEQRQCYPLSVVSAVATAASAYSANTQENWVLRGASTPQGRPAMSCVHPVTAMGPTTTTATGVLATVASSASAAATAAEAVAAQLARLSLQASPTQKRLAFEDDEEDGLMDDISDGQTPASPANAFAAVRSGRADGGGVGSSSGVRGGGRGAGATASNRWASGSCGGAGGRGVCLSGLQLLRSRKRCLEEMQATDLEPPRGAVGLAGVAGGQGAGTALLSGLPLEDLKRQKREGHVLHLQNESNAEEALIPAPQRPDARAPPRAAASSCPPQLGTSSSSSFSQKWSQPPQPVLGPHGEAKSWSQLSSISYVTPTSQSISTGMAAVLGGGSQSQREGRVVGATAYPSAPCSQVLSSLPTNVSQRHQSFKP